MPLTVAEFINKVGFKVNKQDVDKVNNTMQSIKSTATKLLGAIGIGFSLTAINSLIEEFGAANKAIKSSVGELADMDAVQDNLLQKANDAKLAYAEMTNYVANLTKAGADIFPVEDAAQFTSTVAKLMKNAGRNDSQIASLMEGFNKSFQKGIVDTETLNKMLEQAPETANVLAESLGVAKSQLLTMASDGTMTVQQLKAAFMDTSGEIDATFKKANMSVSDAMKNIRNKWGLWLTQMNTTLGITNGIARAMVRFSDKAISVLNRVRNAVQWLGDKLGGTDKLFRLLAIAVGAFTAAIAVANLGNIATAFGKIAAKLGSIRMANMALVAGIILVALLVEDFINFMQGNDSLIGVLLEKAGVDVDKFRNNIVKVWNNIKTILTAVWNGIKNVAIPLFQSIWNAIKKAFEAIGKVIEAVLPGVADFMDRLANGKVDTAEWEQLGEAIAAIAAIILGVIVVMKVFAAVQAIVNAVMMANPITWIILAIVALIAVIVLCIKHWDKIKAAFLKAWDAIKAAWGKVVDFFKGIWDGIAGVFSSVVSWFSNLFQSAWNGIVSVWNAVVGWFQGVWDGITGIFGAVGEWFSGVFSAAWEGIKAVFSGVGEFFSGIWNTIVSLFTTIGTAVGDAISGAVKGAVNAVLSGAISIINGFISAINFAIGIINKIPGVSINKLDKLDVPQLAQGGYVGPNKPQPVIIGDNKREGEIVSPISKMRDTVLTALQMFAASARAGQATRATASVASGGNSVNKSVVQNVEINNKFEGDRAGQQKSAAAMDKAATDMTRELAHGLAYAR